MMIKKSELLCCALSAMFATGHAMEGVSSADRLEQADQIAIWDPEEEKELIAAGPNCETPRKRQHRRMWASWSSESESATNRSLQVYGHCTQTAA